jgi:hypothetical protein
LADQRKQVAGHQQVRYELMDGQQRINALYEYREGSFKLFNPAIQTDADEAQFPHFIQTQACPWGGKGFEELTPELQQKMLNTKLAIVRVTTGVVDAAQDLFIRLQAGMPLNSQEKRDAWPGNFTEYILKMGGKPEIARYPGHDFSSAVMKAKATNRGEYRQLAAKDRHVVHNARSIDPLPGNTVVWKGSPASPISISVSSSPYKMWVKESLSGRVHKNWLDDIRSSSQFPGLLVDLKASGVRCHQCPV